MSAEFRQRKPSEYLKILQRRKWLLILPAIAITTAVSWVVFRLPDVYESSTLIVVRPSTLPKSVVSSDTEDNLTRQLASIAQVVQSRSSLEPLIQKYDLYKSERLRGEPVESVIEMMRKEVNVKVNTTRNDFPPVGLIAQVPIALIARKDLPVKDFKEFVTYAKANQTKMQFGSADRKSVV